MPSMIEDLDSFVDQWLENNPQFSETRRSMKVNFLTVTGSTGRAHNDLLFIKNAAQRFSVLNFKANPDYLEDTKPIFEMVKNTVKIDAALVKNYSKGITTNTPTSADPPIKPTVTPIPHTSTPTTTPTVELTPNPTSTPTSVAKKPAEIDKLAGETIWTEKVRGYLTADPILDGESIYIATQSGYIYSLNKKNGRQIWRYKSNPIVSMGALSNKLIFFVDYSGKLLAIDKNNGQLKWEFQGTANSWASPVVYDESVFLGGPDGLLHSLNALNGNLNWQRNITSKSIGGGTLYKDRLYVNSSDDTLYQIDPSTGETLGHFDLGKGTYENPLIENDLAYVSDWDGHVYALNTVTKNITWNLWTGGVLNKSPIEHNGDIYVGSSDGYVYSVDKNYGSLNWSSKIGDEVMEKLFYSDGLLYAVTRNNHQIASGEYDEIIDSKVVGLDPTTGNIWWEYDSDTQIAASVVADESLLFIPQVDGTLHAFVKPVSENINNNANLPEQIEHPFTPLSSEAAIDILDSVFWSGTMVLGGTKSVADGSGSYKSVPIDYSSEVLQVFETTYHLRMGTKAPDRLKLRLLDNDEYAPITTFSSEFPAWCCISEGADLYMIVNGEYRFAEVFSFIAHESGHAIHRIRNPIAFQKTSQESRALLESVAYLYQASLLRTIGDYTGYNARNLPSLYPAVTNFDIKWKYWVDGINDTEEEHARGQALLWLAILEDPELKQYKEEIQTSITLSADSLIEIANHLILKSRSDSTTYVKNLLNLENLNTHKEFIRSKIVIRNTSEPIDGLLRDDITAVYIP